MAPMQFDPAGTGKLRMPGLRQGGGGGGQAPSVINLSNTAISVAAAIGSDIGRFSTDGSAPVVYTITDNATGYVSSSGARLRLEQLPAGTKSITVLATNALGSKSQTFTLGTVPITMPAGAVARWDTMDSTKLIPNGTDATKLQTWIDKISGYTLDGGTTQPVIDTTNKANGYNGIYSAASGSVQTQMKATAAAVNDSLKALLNAADAKYTIIAVTDEISAAPANARELVSLGNSNTALAGGARNYFLWRHATGGTLYTLLRGDTTTALAAQNGSPMSIAAGKGIVSIRSDGATVTQAYNKTDAGSQPAISDGAVVADTFSLFNRAISGGPGNNFDGRLYAIMIWPRQLTQSEINTVTDLLAADFGIVLPGTPTYIDLSQYTLVHSNDFESGPIYDPNTANDRGVPTALVPHYVAGWAGPTGVGIQGSPGALGSENGWMADPRSARMQAAGVQPFSQDDGVLTISAVPRPSALSDLNLKNFDGLETTVMTGALVSLGLLDQQYGYLEFRVKSPPAQTGSFPALWQMPSCGNWPTENDTWEQFGAQANVINNNLHSVPYAKLMPDSGDVKLGNAVAGPDFTTDYHLFGSSIEPEGIKYYVDRKLVWTVPAFKGVIGISVTAGGSGIVADNGTADGTLALRATGGHVTPAEAATVGDAYATLTIVGGVATAAAMKASGSQYATQPVWVKSGSGAALTGGVTLSSTLATADPPIPMQYHTPFYYLMNLAEGASFLGAVDVNDGTWPRKFAIDYVKVFKKNIPTPAILTGTQSETTAIVNAMTSAGSAPSAARQTLINDVVRQLKSWQLRFDTIPMSGETSEWDVTKLSLWDALDGLVVAAAHSQAAALIDWKRPSATMTLAGSPAFTMDRGFVFGAGKTLATAFDLSTSGIGFRPTDHDIGAWLLSAATETTTNTGMLAKSSSGNLVQLAVTATGFLVVPSSAYGVSWYRDTRPPGIGHLNISRGFRFAEVAFKDGKIFNAGSVAGNENQASPANSILTYGNGTAAQFGLGHWGRRLMPDEAAKLDSILRTYMQAVGAVA